MEFRQLGRSGLRVSVVGLGCNTFGDSVDQGRADRIVFTALDSGINFFDTADAYSDGESERLLGQALGSNRAGAIIATKFGAPSRSPVDAAPFLPSASRRYITYALERSLKRLQTDWIDLYQIHWPDPTTPLEETLDTLGDMVRAGKIRYFGLSNFPGWQVADAAWLARTGRIPGLVSLQCRWNLLERDCEREEVPACRAHGIGILPYFPLGAGLLSGAIGQASPARPDSHFSRLLNHEDPRVAGRLKDVRALALVENLNRFAADCGRSLVDLALSWLINRDVVGSVIAGASKPEQVAANAGAVGWSMTGEELGKIASILDSWSPVSEASAGVER